MHPTKKANLLEAARAHVTGVRSRLREALAATAASVAEAEARLRGPAGPTYALEHRLYLHKLAKRDALASLVETPYFSRCDVVFPNGEAKALHFAKHADLENDIYSWVSPAAALRFEDLGEASYLVSERPKPGLPRREYAKHVRLDRKDQYVIVDGKIVFMSAEDGVDGRTLIHQERLTAKERGFVLPDIVAQMEKAQDQVIRAAEHGPFLIAGPAGSGKTTLALHRLAYLTQSPDASIDFTGTDLVVFVQDASAKAYFGGLLPELGIHGVLACTYEEWALGLLELPATWTARTAAHGEERVDDEYRAAKRRALTTASAPDRKRADEPEKYLAKLYGPYLNREQATLFASQMSRRELDRHDLTALLLRNRAIEGTVKRQTTYYEMKRCGNGQLVRKVGRKSVSYGLAVIDEVENWGREELSLVRGCVDADTQAVVYVGDLSQRTRLGAIATWAEAGESFGDGRQVTLHKVYRNTRQVVEYARSLGFAVEVPASLPEGPQVVCRERVADDVAYCRSVAKAAEGRLVGVLGKGEARLAKLREAFGDTDHVKVMTVEQAQGVEFDTVVLLGLNDFLAAPQGYADASLAEERARVNRDLLYVALTRAMRELHVVC